MMQSQKHPSLMTADALYNAQRNRVNINTDRLFGGLMIFQFIAGVVAALWLSPNTYNGATASIHPHVYAALILGSLIAIPPVFLATMLPGHAVTRYTVSVCQALFSGLLIHLSGGRIETHFHVFGSLAFLSFYRDWRILIPATAVTAVDHLVRGLYYPQSVFGVVTESNWRWLEHAGWVIFEDIFLIVSCVAMTREMRNTAARTAEAFRENRVLEAIRETALDCVIGMDHHGCITEFNAAAERTFGYKQLDVIGKPLCDIIIPQRLRESHSRGLSKFLTTGTGSVLNQRIEVPAMRADGTEFPVELAITAVQLDGPPIFMAYLRDITDRKQFEQQAKHSEMLALVASRTDNAVIITDPQGRIEWANEGFTRVTEYELAEVIGRKPGEFLQGPETDPATVERIRQHIIRRESFTAEIINYSKSGRKYWLAMEARPIHNADGSLRHFMAIESDITVQKKMAEELHASRERFELAVRGSSDGLWDWNLITGEVYYSPAWHEQIGYQVGELAPVHATFFERLHPDDVTNVSDAVADAHAGRTAVYRVEYRFRHRDGTYRWILARGVTLHDDSGRAIRMAGSTTDVTEQHVAAETIQKAEEKYRGLFENSVLGIFQSTRDGKYLSANPAMARIYGYDSPEQLVGGPIDIGQQHYIRPERRKELVATLDREGTVIGFEAEIRRTDGSHRWISKRARVVRNENGDPLYYEGTVEDITEAKAAQAALRQAKEDAIQARVAAEAASVAKSQFLATMSHEIRTPLNGVIGIADLLIRKGGLTEQQNRYANVIKSSGDSLLSLINDILDFSKIEAGKLEISPIEFEFRSCVEDVVEMLTPKAEAKKLALACHVSRSVPTRLVGDSDRIRQNLTNLVNNAVKFTESGHVLIRATVASQDQTHCVVKFIVEDTGIGIPKDRLDRLFKSFSQVDASTTRKFGGTGLGLAIVKQLAALMGGEVGVDSEVGHGSSFWFTARFAIAPPSIAESTNRSDLTSAIHGMRVLVVDDQPAYLEVIKEQLAVWNIAADTCTSTDEAKHKLVEAHDTQDPYRIVLVDLVMPASDTTGFLREMTRDQRFSETVFRLMTALDSNVGERLTSELGLASCLHKPIRHSTLFDTIVNVLACRISDAPVIRTNSSIEAGKLHAHILLAEDNEVNQEVASGILTDAGCTVEIVGNGAKALAAVLDPTKRFDLVLMDCMMPEMDGFEATRRIRAEIGRTLPIIALTANAISGDRERCLEAGMTDYVTKPIDPDLLIETMRTLLKQQSTKITHNERNVNNITPVPTAAPSIMSVPAINHVAPIDSESLLRRCRGKIDLAERLLTLFSGSVDQQLADLRTSLEKAEWTTFTRLAHTIKGTGANLGANTVSRVAGELEQLGKTADTDAAAISLAKLQAEVAECLAYIPTVLNHKPESIKNPK